jgi:hypothetical protein
LNFLTIVAVAPLAITPRARIQKPRVAQLSRAKGWQERVARPCLSRYRVLQRRSDLAKHGITAAVEPIRIEQINDASERLPKSDVKYHFVIDMASLK